MHDDHMTTIDGKNLSEVWAKAFVKCWKTSGGILAPALVRFGVCESDVNWALENSWIRTELDSQLEMIGIRSVGQSNIETVAGTIFPESLWLRSHGDRHEFYRLYEKVWPAVKSCSGNCHGVYFHRLIAFGQEGNRVNQLETILTTWKAKVHRHSALQAAVFDPLQDHKMTRQRGFPCLQQVVFHPNGPNGQNGLSIVAFYATQLLLEKAYGNYLGVYRLGKFMASEMGLRLASVVCIAADLKLGKSEHGKACCKSLAEALERLLANAE